jgi:hypothetical protein
MGVVDGPGRCHHRRATPSPPRLGLEFERGEAAHVMESSTTQEIAKPNGTIWLAVDIRPFFKPPPSPAQWRATPETLGWGEGQ